MIVAAVGTFCQGFDELVAGADAAVGALGRPGYAQIGQGRYIPAAMAWDRMLTQQAFHSKLAQASLVVCHAGIGILGEAMRAGRPIIAVPRRGTTSSAHPANDQLALARALAARYPIGLCEDTSALASMIADLWPGLPQQVRYGLGSDVPTLVAEFLGTARPRAAGWPWQG